MKKTILITTISILLISLIVFNYYYNKYSASIETLTDIEIEDNVKISDIKTNDTKKLFLLTANNNSKLFYPKSLDIKSIPAGNLKGSFQNIINLEYTPNKILNVKLVKTNDSDICGIDIFNIKDNTWKILKTKVITRRLADELPFFEIVYSGNMPYLFVWGGINYNTNEFENSLEIIDVLNDKLIAKQEINFSGGSFAATDINNNCNNNICYLIGAKPLNNEILTDLNINNFRIKHIDFTTNTPKLITYKRVIKNNLSSSLDSPATIAADIKNSKLTELVFPNNIYKELEINNIEIPQKLKGYKLVNIIPLNYISQYILMTFENSDGKQVLALFNCNKDLKNDNDEKRFKIIKNLNSKINLQNITYLEKNDKKYIFLFINDDKIFKMELN